MNPRAPALHPATPPAAALHNPLLTVSGLTVEYAVRTGWLKPRRSFRAVDDVSLQLGRGQTLGILGESGSGKTTLGRAILRLVDAAAGQVKFAGVDVLSAPAQDLRRLRRRMQIIFQDSDGSLNPRLPVDLIVGEALQFHGFVRTRGERRRHVAELLERVGMPADSIDRRPRSFSGGQRQRIGIARALALRPELVVCDEPVSALDASIQVQIIALLRELQRDFGLSYIFITHSIPAARAMSDNLAVMYFGRIIEQGSAAQVLDRPLHPYTQALLAAAPALPGCGNAVRIQNAAQFDAEACDGPAAAPGCAFAPRCPWADSRCRTERPVLRGIGTVQVACHFADAERPAVRSHQ